MRQRVLQTLRTFSWQQWLVALLFLLVLGFTGLYAVRTTRHAIYWHYHQDEQIHGWMTVGYVAHSYRVPRQILYQSLGLPPQFHDKRPLRNIAKSQNRSMNEIRAILQDAIAHSRLQYPSPSPPNERRTP